MNIAQLGFLIGRLAINHHKNLVNISVKYSAVTVVDIGSGKLAELSNNAIRHYQT